MPVSGGGIMARKSWRGEESKLGRYLTYDDLAAYGIDQETAFSVTLSAQIALDCVKKAPELHIISLIENEKSCFYNRYVPHADAYYLTDGDPNPDLVEVVEPLCIADIDELEEGIREECGGQLSAFDQLFVKFLRMLVTQTVNLDALVDPNHRRSVRALAKEEAKWKRAEDPPAGPLFPRKRA